MGKGLYGGNCGEGKSKHLSYTPLSSGTLVYRYRFNNDNRSNWNSLTQPYSKWRLVEIDQWVHFQRLSYWTGMAKKPIN